MSPVSYWTAQKTFLESRLTVHSQGCGWGPLVFTLLRAPFWVAMMTILVLKAGMVLFLWLLSYGPNKSVTNCLHLSFDHLETQNQMAINIQIVILCILYSKLTISFILIFSCLYFLFTLIFTHLLSCFTVSLWYAISGPFRI